MSGFSSPEFLLIVVLALVVLGPKRLPEIANKVGSWVGQARRMTRVMRRQLEEELEVENINQIATPEQLMRAPKPAPTQASTSNPADPAASDEAPEVDEALDAPRADHIPNDDDTYSPLHAEEDGDDDADKKEKSA